MYNIGYNKNFVLTAGVAVLITSTFCLFSMFHIKRKRNKLEKISNSYSNLIGNTPLVKLQELSRLTGCNVLAKVVISLTIIVKIVNNLLRWNLLIQEEPGKTERRNTC